jgi:hypothetical protein
MEQVRSNTIGYTCEVQAQRATTIQVGQPQVEEVSCKSLS